MEHWEVATAAPIELTNPLFASISWLMGSYSCLMAKRSASVVFFFPVFASSATDTGWEPKKFSPESFLHYSVTEKRAWGFLIGIRN